MKKQQFTAIFIFVNFLGHFLSAQTYNTGMNFDDEAYKKQPKKATLLSRDYAIVPASASVKKYCPTPRNQSGGTCVGWSSSWGVRTILEAKSKGMTDPIEITKQAFSPNFTYLHIKSEKDINCANGAFVDEALELFITKGVPKEVDYPSICAQTMPNQDIYDKAAQYKIKGKARLFDANETPQFTLKACKKTLAAGTPILIGMLCPDSFFGAKDVWKPTEIANNKMGGHAMCVVGYDDNKHGGAFEIMNSWGTGWGNGGFIWIKYKDFTDFVKYGYEPIDFPTNTPANVPDLAGSFRLETSDKEEMTANFVNKVGNVAVYQTQKPYFSGTKFRMYITNEQPAFVYALGSDLETQKVNVVFPFDETMSPVLNYKGCSVALPSEKHFVRMDNTLGKDYLCLLYSKDNLDIQDIKNKIAEAEGTFAEKVSQAIGDDLVEKPTFQNGKISFSAKSNNKKIVAMILEVEHK